MVLMRLVRDDEMAENDLTEEGSPRPRDAESDEQPTAEIADGAVADTAEETTEEPAADETQVDFGVLEALLFSTHHPLTAGRLAELLDLDSTKPMRRAIKELNRQYEETGRSFRVEQVAGGYQLLTLPE